MYLLVYIFILISEQNINDIFMEWIFFLYILFSTLAKT